MNATRDLESELLRAFREAVRAKISRDLDMEGRKAEDLRSRVVPAAREAVRAARERGLCTRAWIFGSYAWGTPADGSDLDMMVEDCPDPDELAALVMRATGIMVHLIQAQKTPESLRERILASGVGI